MVEKIDYVKAEDLENLKEELKKEIDERVKAEHEVMDKIKKQTDIVIETLTKVRNDIDKRHLELKR